MSLEKILEIARAMAEIGIRYVKITGGEPLLRNDVVQIVKGLSDLNRFDDISLTTNGLLLKDLARPLKEAGLCRVNIGCDSISSNITKKNFLNILPGIIAAKECGLMPIKLNMVVLKNINSSEIDEIISLASRYELILQLIELIPNKNFDFEKYYLPLSSIEERLKKMADSSFTRKLQGRRRYYIDGCVIEIVSPSHKTFCQNCSKIRVTSDGRIKPCLMREDNTVVFENIDSIKEAIKRKGYA